MDTLVGGGGPYVILYSPGSLICMCITLYKSSFLDFPLASCDVVILGGLASKIISHIRSNSLSNLLDTKTGVCAVLCGYISSYLFIISFFFLSLSLLGCLIFSLSERRRGENKKKETRQKVYTGGGSCWHTARLNKAPGGLSMIFSFCLYLSVCEIVPLQPAGRNTLGIERERERRKEGI